MGVIMQLGHGNHLHCFHLFCGADVEDEGEDGDDEDDEESSKDKAN